MISNMDWKKEVLEKIKPKKEEEAHMDAALAAFIKKLNRVLGDAKAVLGGSGAKGTWIAGRHEADIFVSFPKEKYASKTDKLSDILEKRIKKIIKTIDRLHGSRDYFQIKEGSFTFEIVPIIGIKKAHEALNITDVSPLHATWVHSHSTPKIRDDIRLAKAFCKAQGCYGAESYIRGFSGYVLELLVINNKSFEKFLKASAACGEKQVIDPGKLYKKNESVWTVMSDSKLQSPIIVVDPVDKSRNAAAALSKEKLTIFQKAASQLLKKPSPSFFERDAITIEKLKKKKGKNAALWIDVESIDAKEDVAGAQLMLAFEYLKKQLDKFGVISAGWEWDKKKYGSLWFILKTSELSKTEWHKGPPVEMEKAVADFKKKHKKIVAKEGRVWAEIKVEYPKVKDFAKEILDENYCSTKIKNIKKIDAM